MDEKTGPTPPLLTLDEAVVEIKKWLYGTCKCSPDETWQMRPGPLGCPEHDGPWA